jgi:hypothetical protein
MHTWHSPAVVVAVAIGLALSGCRPPGPSEPLTTDGPNQVILFVPGMT